MLRTAALSWDAFDDEADAPTFDVLGDLAAPAGPAKPCPAAPPIPYAYPSLAPRSVTGSGHAQLPAPDGVPRRGCTSGDGRSDAAVTATLPPTATAATGAAPCGSSARPRPPVVGAAVFKPFKPPRKVVEENRDCLPAPSAAPRPAAQDRSPGRCSPVQPAALSCKREPGLSAQQNFVADELKSTSNDGGNAQQVPLHGSRGAAAARQIEEVPWRRARRRETSSPNPQRTDSGTAEACALPHASRLAAPDSTPWRHEAAALAPCVNSTCVSAAGASAVLAEQKAQPSPALAGERSRKQAKRMFPACDDEAAPDDWQACTLATPV